MARYAEKTQVPVERSKAELDGVLARAGAQQRGFFNDEELGKAVVVFSLQGRQVKLSMSFSTVADVASVVVAKRTEQPHGWHSWPASKRQQWVKDKVLQAERQRWRAMLLCVKAKLELIADGESTLEREFLHDILLPNGRTVGESVLPTIAEAYATGRMPPLLPEYGG